MTDKFDEEYKIAIFGGEGAFTLQYLYGNNWINFINESEENYIKIIERNNKKNTFDTSDT